MYNVRKQSVAYANLSEILKCATYDAKGATHSKYDVIHALDCLCLFSTMGYGDSHVVWDKNTHANQINIRMQNFEVYAGCCCFCNQQDCS